MHEPLEQNRMSKTQWKAPHYGAGAGLLVLGLLAGRAFFPLEIPKPFIVEKEKRVEVPVERIVEKRVPYEVIKYVDRVVEKRVEVPVEKVVVKRVEVPVEKIVEKRIEIPVDRIVYRDRIVEKTVPSAPPGLRGWRQVTKGMTHQQIRSILGEPLRIRSSGGLEEWYFSVERYSSYVWFGSGDLVVSWSEPN
jgi:hypothetical protein